MSTASSLEMKQQPIRHLLVYVNPSADSFNRAMVDAYVTEAESCGQEVVIRDLYAMNFDPVLRSEERPLHDAWTSSPDVAEELAQLMTCDILVLVYPIWFGLPPAMLKGYVDRVLGAGYSFRDMVGQVGQHVLKGKPLLSFSTSGTSHPWLNAQGQEVSLREIFDVYLWRGFAMKQSEHVMIDNVVPSMSALYASKRLELVRQTAERTCSTLANQRAFQTAE